MSRLDLSGGVEAAVKETLAQFDGLVPANVLRPKLLQRPPFAYLRTLVVSTSHLSVV